MKAALSLAAAGLACVSVLCAQSPPSPPLDPQPAVKLISNMFAPNPLVLVEATGKPMPGTGSWGAQISFPAGLPVACRAARLPCVRVVYRVPDQKLVCSWIVGYVVTAQPGPDGRVAHTAQSLLLDEDASAARYTMKTAFPEESSEPRRLGGDRLQYPPTIASLHLSGQVGVRVLVGPDGKVKSVLSTAGPRTLAQSAAETIRSWTFEPVIVGEQAVSYRKDVLATYDGGAPPKLESYHGGSTLIFNADPHINGGMGFVSQGASGTTMESCTAVSCTYGAPPVPQ